MFSTFTNGTTKLKCALYLYILRIYMYTNPQLHLPANLTHHAMKSLHRSDIPANPLSFLKLILSNDKKTPTIRLPEKFTEIHGGSLLKTVTLRIPNGDIWHVDLEKSNGEIWLNNGWMEFAVHYDLKFGNLLEFDYKGFSIFNVLIYDVTACEIVYPKKKCILGHHFTETRARRRLNSREKANTGDLSSLDQDQETEIKITAECSSSKVNEIERNKAIEAARVKYKPKKPCFMVYMSPNHIAGRFNVDIPLNFLREHWRSLKKNQKCVLKLGSKTWETRTNGRPALKVGGWKMFMQDSGVAASDVCVFELIDSSKNLLKVSIIKAHLLL